MGFFKYLVAFIALLVLITPLFAQFTPSQSIINDLSGAAKITNSTDSFPLKEFTFPTITPPPPDTKFKIPQTVLIQPDKDKPQPPGGPQFFTVSNGTMSDSFYGKKRMTVIPAGSYVKARVISGAEATTSDTFPVLLQLDYAIQTPNRRVVNFKNCMMNGRARANLSIERVVAQVDKLSCVKSTGEYIDVAINGYLAGHDSNFGATGRYMGHEQKVVLAAILDSLTKTVGTFGQALAQAQIKEQAVGEGSATTSSSSIASVVTENGSPNIASNVMNQDKYILGSQIYSTSEAFSRIAKFYLDQALALLPTIGLSSGQDVWVVLLDQVKVSSLFADGGYDNSSPY